MNVLYTCMYVYYAYAFFPYCLSAEGIGPLETGVREVVSHCVNARIKPRYSGWT